LELRQRLQLVAFPSSVGLPKLVAPYDLRVESLWRQRCQAGEPAPFRFKPPNIPNRAIVPQERRYLAAGTGRPAVSTKQIGRQAY